MEKEDGVDDVTMAMAGQRAGNMLGVQAAWGPSVVIKSGKCVNQPCLSGLSLYKRFFNMS